MANVSDLLAERTRKSEHAHKMIELSKRSANGNLTSFSGVFGVSELSAAEKSEIENLLHSYATDSKSISKDLDALISITSEVKAINNQAALLHGERIKRAQTILTRYRNGAFTTWLTNTYGNRQTPYNFLQYHEFYQALPKGLQSRLEAMPRQAIYTLASRDGPLEKKQLLIENYHGQTKAELLSVIRDQFPLDIADKRQRDFGEEAVKGLEKIANALESPHARLSKLRKTEIAQLLERIHEIIGS